MAENDMRPDSVEAQDTERWVAAPNFPSYEVSSFGRIRRQTPRTSGKAGAVRRLTASRSGYLHCDLYRDGQAVDVRAHRLVCEAFHGAPPSPKHHVAHRDNDPANNRSENLRWATAKENEADKIAAGSVYCGARHHRTKLTVDEVREIRAGHIAGVREAARYYGVTHHTISKIRAGLIWKSVP